MSVLESTTICSKIPLNQTNTIQPHGVLIVVDRSINNILQVSENITELIQMAAAEIAGKPATDLFADNSINILRQILGIKKEETKIPVLLSLRKSGAEYRCSVFAGEKYCIIEIFLPDFFDTPRKTLIDSYRTLSEATASIDALHSLEEICLETTKLLRKVMLYDKVMVYQFDENWNGTVIAEDADEDMESYLGLTFPESDIPKPARDMYKRNPVRIIPNREYSPVKLYPLLNPIDHGFTNLINVDLRSVASVHLEYLKNMNIKASMSARILINGNLWGLIAFHHKQAKYLSIEECIEVELIANSLAQKIQLFQYSEKIQMKHNLTVKYTALLEKLITYSNIEDAIKDNLPEIMEILNAHGIVFCWDNCFYTKGETPDTTELNALIFWLRHKTRFNTWYEHRLSVQFADAKSYASKASGIMALPIQPDKGHFLIVFRPELIGTISWGGNPNNTINFEPGSTVYHPRSSFQIWKETVHNTAQKWNQEEVMIAEQLRNFIIQCTLSQIIA